MADLYGYITNTDNAEDESNSSISETISRRILGHEARPLSTLFMFLSNKRKLDEGKDWTKDKRFHARANAQAGQIYDPETALTLSFGRELWDILRKNTWAKKKNITFQDVLNDSRKDWEADSYGWMNGVLHPLKDVDNTLDYEYLDSLNK